MAENFLFPGGILSLPREAAMRLLRGDNGDACLYYLALLADDAHSLSWPRPRVEAAHQALIDQGLLGANQAPAMATPPQKQEPEAPPSYGHEDVTLALQSQSAFPGLVTELERRLGKILSPSDLQTLLLLYDFLALPPEVILLLLNYTIENLQKKYGPGRLPTMSQIKKEAFRWQRAGIDSLEAAEAHLQALEKRSAAATRILPILDIHGRSPVEGERRYLEAWEDMGFADDALRLAYEKTVLKKQSLNWPYMNSILKSWHEKRLHTKEAIVAAEHSPRRSQTTAAQQAPGAIATTPEGQARARKDLDRLDRLLAGMEET